MKVLRRKLQLSAEAKIVQRETHILEGKKRSLAESEKRNVMEGKETLVEGKKKSSVVWELKRLEREEESLVVIVMRWSLVEGNRGRGSVNGHQLREGGFNHQKPQLKKKRASTRPKSLQKGSDQCPNWKALLTVEETQVL